MLSIVFDYAGYLDSMAIQNAQIEKNGLIKIRNQYLDYYFNVSSVANSINNNRRAILGELPFHKKDYINNEALSYFYDLELTNIKESLMSLSITLLHIVEEKLQLIINENKRMDFTETVWYQSIVINATIPTEGDEVIFEGQKVNQPTLSF